MIFRQLADLFGKSQPKPGAPGSSARKPGITALISCQNEELMVAPCIASYLRVADEIIVVDNGSTDQTKAFAQEIAAAFPDRVRYFEDDSLQHLFENRQYALEQSTHEWIIRVDSDYVCYTDGARDVGQLRHALANWRGGRAIDILNMTRIDVWFDFFHVPARDLAVYGGRHPDNAPKDRRVYQWFENMRFERQGRWEAVALPKRGVKHHTYTTPHWMHCDVKSNHNHFMRSERTNWRELGDFETYPTLRAYIDAVMIEKYGTDDFQTACATYIDRMLQKDSEPFDVAQFGDYPALVQLLIDTDCGYTTTKVDGRLHRERQNLPDMGKIIDAARGLTLT